LQYLTSPEGVSSDYKNRVLRRALDAAFTPEPAEALDPSPDDGRGRR
jgi:hypothetical protein